MELVSGPSGRVAQRVVGIGFLVRGRVLSGLDHRFAVCFQSAECLLTHGCPGEEVVSEALAIVGFGREDSVGVQPGDPVRVLRVARPWDPASAAKYVVADAGVVARPPAGTFLPGPVGVLRALPLEKGRSFVGHEAHPCGVVEEDIKVRARFTWRLYRLIREVHGAVHVRECSRLLSPARCRQHHVGVLGSLGEKQVLNNEEHTVLVEDPADPFQLRHRHRRVRCRHPQEFDAALFDVAEDLHRMGRR